MDLRPYTYEPLHQGEIRLLSLLPNGKSHLRHVQLQGSSRSLKYAALSYTWGNDITLLPFECDGRALPARENLLHALTALRDACHATLWIDALCINQADEEEKMVQIWMMAEIYRKANKVLVRDRASQMPGRGRCADTDCPWAAWRSGWGQRSQRPKWHWRRFEIRLLNWQRQRRLIQGLSWLGPLPSSLECDTF